MTEWFYMLIMILIALVIYWNQLIISRLRKYKEQLCNYRILLTLLILGFLFGWEYTEDWGCFGPRMPLFGIKYMFLSLISIGLITASYFAKQQRYKRRLILIELGFWVVKLFYFKNNLVSIFFYDSLALIFRLLIISSLYSSLFKLRTIILMTLTVISVKSFVFSESIESIVEFEERLKRSKITQAHLIGNWIGVCSYDTILIQEIVHRADTGFQNWDWITETDTEFVIKRIPIIDSLEIYIDSNQMNLSNFRNTDSLWLRYTFDSEFGGYLNEMEDTISFKHNYTFWVNYQNSDTLKLQLSSSSNYYKFLMTQKTD